MSSTKTAAWSVSALKNTIESATDYIITNPSSSTAGLLDGVITHIPQLSLELDYQIFYQQGEFKSDAISGYLDSSEPNIYLSMKEDYLVLEILEGNTNFEKENFEVEVFFDSAGSSATPGPSTLEQMSFASADSTQFITPKPLGNTQTNTGDVEYYFNLYLDEELPARIMDAINMTPRDMASNTSRFSFNRDLYITADDEEPC